MLGPDFNKKRFEAEIKAGKKLGTNGAINSLILDKIFENFLKSYLHELVERKSV